MAEKILVLGVGNALLKDDGVGLHVIAAFRNARGNSSNLVVRDGGTLGLALLPDLEGASALIVVDAANFCGSPGEVRVFESEAMDAQLGVSNSSAHGIAVANLVGAARLSGSLPNRRALVGIAPLSVEWGLEPTPEVAASIPAACAAIDALIERWAA